MRTALLLTAAAALTVENSLAAVLSHEANPCTATVRKVLHLTEPGSWFENIAVRGDGSILTTRLDVARVYQIDPETGKYSIVARFDNVTSALGIVEYAPDVFAVAVGNFSTKTFVSTPGTYSIQTLDLNQRPGSSELVTPRLLAKVPEAQLLNGLTFRAPSSLYSADSAGYQVYEIDTKTRAVSVAVPRNKLFEAPSSTGIGAGVNGLKWNEAAKQLIYTNSNQITAGYIPLQHGKLGRPRELASGTAVNATDFDDVALGPRGDLYLATGPSNSMVFLSRGGKQQFVITENAKSTATPNEPTASAFARGKHDRNTLYVSTGGGGLGAQIVAYDLGSA